MTTAAEHAAASQVDRAAAETAAAASGAAAAASTRSAPFALLAPLVLAVAWGCGGDGGAVGGSGADVGAPGAARSPGVQAAVQLANPAAPGSGQPFLEPAGDGVWMSWTEPSPTGHRVAAAFHHGGGDGWGPVRTVAEGDAFFVNWADFPSVRVFGDRLFAHWLWRGGQGTYDYGVRVAWSDDDGATWSPALTPHDDGTPTEHGFVSFFPRGDEVWAAWLDGRQMVEPGGPMSLRARRVGLAAPTTPPAAGGAPANGQAPAADPPPARAAHALGPETIVDAMTCECCQTDAAVANGVPVVVYRDRAPGEIRDIHVSRLVDGAWTPSRAVHDDGWFFGGCPVNGPAMAARGASVAVAWFTAPDNEPRVHVAFSSDGGATFGPPTRLDDGGALGRVDVVLLGDGSALATWLAQGGGATPGAAIVGRRIAPDGAMSAPLTLADSDAARASGFPRIARLGADRLMLAWTDPNGEGRVRTSAFDLALWPLRQ